jgi:hypothetical protein
MAWDHFLQAETRITRVVHVRHSATPDLGREVRTPVSASSRGGDWRTKQAEMPSPGVTSPGPYVTSPPPESPVEMRWLLTSAKLRSSSEVFCTGAVPHR